MGQALYRKYRSKSLDEIVGQSHVTSILKRALERGNVAHAYLLTGPRGVGKTSIARILAHEINGLPYADESTHLDIIEIDAASNNSVEDIRDLRERVAVAPSSAKHKVYIIDEVHMLSKSAFNALLKTLEEPPAHVVFILATTDADKLPATIVSRVQRFNFRAISHNDIRSHLRTIADAEQIEISDEALALISQHAGGSFRDSISLLDQLRNAAEGAIAPADIEAVLGLAESQAVMQLISAYRSGDLAQIVATLDELESRGTPAVVVAGQLIESIRAGIVEQADLLPLLDALLEVSRSAWPRIKLLTALTTRATVAVPTAASTPKSTPKPSQSTPTKVTKPAQVKPTPEISATPTVAVVESQPVIGESKPFAWSDFLQAVKQSASGAHSLLMKCAYDFDGTTLVIYAGKKFAKAQIDKALPALAAALESCNVSDGHINVLASTKPPEDSAAAAILDIMGGGEEVRL